MSRVALSLFILTFTTVIAGQDSTCVSLMGHDSDRFFIGEVTSINASTREATESPLKVEEIGVRITDPLSAKVPGGLTLINPLPRESFHHHRFKIGETYLFDSAERDGEIWISGEFTVLLSKAGEILDLIDFLAAESDGAVVYGTVKQYVGRKNFHVTFEQTNPKCSGAARYDRRTAAPGRAEAF